MAIKENFRIDEAAKLSDLEPTMVDYLCRHQIIEPSKSKKRSRGSPRRFSFSDVVFLRIVAQLTAKGVSPKRLASDIKSLRQKYDVVDPTKSFGLLLVTDGERVYLRRRDEALLSPDGQFVFTFVVDIDVVASQVKAKLTAA